MRNSSARLLAFVLALILALTGCGGEEPAAVVEPTPAATVAPSSEATAEPTVAPVLPEDPEEFCREFLEIFLTSDYEGRYTAFTTNYEQLMSAAGATGLTEEEYERVIGDYHACVRPYISDDLYDKMCRNRDLSRWDQGAEKLGVSMVPGQIDIVVTQYDLNMPCNFNATIQLSGQHNTEASITGELTMREDGKIDAFQIWYYIDFPAIGEKPATGAATAAAYFREYYTQLAASDLSMDYSHMDLEQLENMASSTTGIAVDTEELSVEVLGALFSGSTAQIHLRVTAKELETVLREGSNHGIGNYEFGDAIGYIRYLLGFADTSISTKHVYSDTKDTLAPNQYELYYQIFTREPITKDSLLLALKDFGYIERTLVPLYEGYWQVDVAVDPAADSSIRVFPKEEILLEEYRLTVDEIHLSPLGCQAYLTCPDGVALEEWQQYLLRELVFEESRNTTLMLTDGTRLDQRHFTVGCGGGESTFDLRMSFAAPIAVESIETLEVLGTTISLK